MDGQIDGVVSAPLNKEAFHMAGYDYADELAYLSHWTHSPQAAIMGVMKDRIWTIAVAEHVPFSEILGLVKKERVLECIRQMAGALTRVGVQRPRIAVAALNVHAGEGGLYGKEEITEITPAIQAARDTGLDVTGPVPADMVFPKALAGEYDGVVCMYHDQANIARKLQGKSEGATVFIGLAVPCGTTAHGTAFDKAGLGIADPGSLWAALRYTARLAAANQLGATAVPGGSTW
jgi:4-hydroxythreonine-4-phosphate dehydrogenase